MFIIIMQTSVESRHEQGIIKNDLDRLTGADRWSIDLGDCQKVLRVVALHDITDQIISVLASSGFNCSIMDVFHADNPVTS